MFEERAWAIALTLVSQILDLMSAFNNGWQIRSSGDEI